MYGLTQGASVSLFRGRKSPSKLEWRCGHLMGTKALQRGCRKERKTSFGPIPLAKSSLRFTSKIPAHCFLAIVYPRSRHLQDWEDSEKHQRTSAWSFSKWIERDPWFLAFWHPKKSISRDLRTSQMKVVHWTQDEKIFISNLNLLLHGLLAKLPCNRRHKRNSCDWAFHSPADPARFSSSLVGKQLLSGILRLHLARWSPPTVCYSTVSLLPNSPFGLNQSSHREHKYSKLDSQDPPKLHCLEQIALKINNQLTWWGCWNWKEKKLM